MDALSGADVRIQRCVWLAFKLRERRHRVTYPEYAARFGTTIRTYHRDLNVLRRIGFTIASERDHTGNVRCTEVSI